MCPALRCGRHDRGPDGFRERALNMSAVSHSAVGWHGVSRSSVRPIATFCCRPFTRDASGSGDRRGTVCLTAGYHGPHDMGHLVGQRDRRELARTALQQAQQSGAGMPAAWFDSAHHDGCAEHQQLAQPFVALARDPPSRGLPAVDFCFGVRPSQAAR
jgi:hypothetical protein